MNKLNYSDHNSVVLKIVKTATKWNIFQDYLKEVKLPSGSCSSMVEVDEAIFSITETISIAKKLADVKILLYVRQLFPDLEILIKEKKRITKSWQRYRQAEDKAELNRLTNKIIYIYIYIYFPMT